MKKRRALSVPAFLLAAVITVTASLNPALIGSAKTNYVKDTVYDATETYLKVQPDTYSYNGYKMEPFVQSDGYLASIGVGEGYALSTAGVVKKGSKLVIELKKPIDSKKFDTIILQMKQVPGNTYEAYNVNDDILSTTRKTFSFGSYDVEKIAFQSSLFADEKGMVSAIMLKNIKADAQAQLFVDGFSLTNSPYQLNKTYDANETYLKRQTSTSYDGLTIVPFGEVGTFWSEQAKVESGSALIASKPGGVAVDKGEILVLEFVHEIQADKFPYINLQLATATGGGASFDFYNVNDFDKGRLGEKKDSGSAAFWSLSTVSLKAEDFADNNGNVKAIAMRLTSEAAATFSVGSFSLTAKKQAGGTQGSTQTGNDLSKDSQNQYDGNEKNIVVQTTDTFRGIKIRPLSGCGSELAGWGVGEGQAVYTADNVEKGDVIAIEFVRPIDSKKTDLITMSIKQVAGYSYNVYKADDTTLKNPVKTIVFGSYDIEITALRTKLFAEKDGQVRALLLKCVKAGAEKGQFFVDGYSLGQDPYKKGVLYDADEDHVKIQGSDTYGSLKVSPFNERSVFWDKEAKLESEKGYAVIAHRVDGTALQKGDLMILEFVTDIDTNKFEVLNLTLATASAQGAILEVYNIYDADNGTLGEPTQRVNADFWSFKTNNISLKGLADKNGYVGAIGLRLVSDAAETFSVGGFSLGSLNDLVEKGKPQILDNKITVFETDDAYEFVVEFNSTGNEGSKDNEETLKDVVSFNGMTLKEINKEEKNITLSVDLMGRYCMTLRVKKSYKGDAAVKNADRHFVGNCVQIKKGYQLPNGEKLKETFALHVYLTDGITDIVSDEKLQSIGVNSVTSGLDANGNLTISVYFTNQITGNPVYFLCNPDSFNKKNVESLNAETILYDSTVAEAFIYGGYKSSLMDHIRINGNTVAEWMAVDQLKGSLGYDTAVMVHYGQAGDKAASIIFSGNTEIGKQMNKAYESGTIDLQLDEGLKFTTARELKKDVTYQYRDGKWKQTHSADFAVYYDGQKVVNGQTLQVENEPSVHNVVVTGEGQYDILEERTGDTAVYTIKKSEKTKMIFTVEGNAVVMPAVQEVSYTPYIIGGIAGIVILIGLAVVIIITTRRRKKPNE